MTVYDLAMTVTNLNCYTAVIAHDDHDKIVPDVQNWGDLMEHYPESEVLFFDYELCKITLHKIRKEENYHDKS